MRGNSIEKWKYGYLFDLEKYTLLEKQYEIPENGGLKT